MLLLFYSFAKLTSAARAVVESAKSLTAASLEIAATTALSALALVEALAPADLTNRPAKLWRI
jgi:hypothetical protein